MKVVLRGKFIAINDYIKKKKHPKWKQEDNMQEQMDNISRKIETLKKESKGNAKNQQPCNEN